MCEQQTEMLKKIGHIKSQFTGLLATVMVVGTLVFGTYQLVKPKPAEAFVCTCGTPCTLPGTISVGWAQGLGYITTQLSTSGSAITTVYSNLITSFTTTINQELTDAYQNLSDWLDDFLVNELTPAMQDQTGQLNALIIDQTRQLASAVDGQIMNQTLRMRDIEEARARREATPSETVCVSGSVSGGMTRSRVLSKAMSRALPAETLGVSGNQPGSAAEFGDTGYQRHRFENYVNLYCNPESNDGEGCFGNPAAPYPDQDILVREVLFKENTIDLESTPGRRQSVTDLVANLVEPEAPSPVSVSDATGTLEGRERYLQNRAIRAQRALAKKVVYDVVARRTPGSRMGDYVQELRNSAGVDLVDMSENPSWNELVNALAEERFWSGVYNIDNITEPEATMREKITVQALEVLQLNDLLDQYRNISMLAASQAAHKTMTTGRDSGLANAPASGD